MLSSKQIKKKTFLFQVYSHAGTQGKQRVAAEVFPNGERKISHFRAISAGDTILKLRFSVHFSGYTALWEECAWKEPYNSWYLEVYDTSHAHSSYRVPKTVVMEWSCQKRNLACLQLLKIASIKQYILVPWLCLQSTQVNINKDVRTMLFASCW